jgi:hypothetical protein
LLLKRLVALACSDVELFLQFGYRRTAHGGLRITTSYFRHFASQPFRRLLAPSHEALPKAQDHAGFGL